MYIVFQDGRTTIVPSEMETYSDISEGETTEANENENSNEDDDYDTMEGGQIEDDYYDTLEGGRRRPSVIY
jgi:hypothetical protein